MTWLDSVPGAVVPSIGVICTMCGRDNPSHLIFCQECGQRLAPRASPSSAELQPATSPLAATASAPAVAPEGLAPPSPPHSTPSPARPRPPAPEISFVPRASAPQGVPQTTPIARTVSELRPTLPCVRCGTPNEHAERFCIACGQPLASPEAATGDRVAAIELMRTVPDAWKPEPPTPQSGYAAGPRAHGSPDAPHDRAASDQLEADHAGAQSPANDTLLAAPELHYQAPYAPLPDWPLPPAGSATDPAPSSAARPIAPIRVIDVGEVAQRVTESLCPRCHRARDEEAQFCRFCGLSLRPTPAGTATATASPHAPERGETPPPAVAAVAQQFHERRTPPPSTVLVFEAPGARLVLVTRDGGEGSRFGLTAEATDIGRLEGQILFADDLYVSPRHARIVLRGGAFFIRDLESTNGVFMRIPFLSGSSGFASPDAPAVAIARQASGSDEGDERRSRGEGSGGGATFPRAEMGSEAPLESGLPSEQTLGDQEFFLVGQQVLRFEVVKQAEEGFGAASENGTLLFGTPAAPRYARLMQRTVEGMVRDVYNLRKAETVIGRESADIVFTDDPFLSRRHAAVRMYGAGPQPRRFTLADLGSSNGTFLRIRDEVRLRHGDHFRVGQQLLRFDALVGGAGV